MLKLIGADANRYYAWELEPGIYSVGRKSDCRLAITDNTVSRNHAELMVGADGVSCILTDLGSHNGTMVNGKRISARTPVAIGDHIRFGQTEFKLTSRDGASALTGHPTAVALSDKGAEKSVVLSMAEALKPLPSRVTDMPDLLPTLFDMARMLVLPEPQETMLERALKLVAKLVPAERLAVLFLSEDQNQVITAASYLAGGKDLGEFTLSRTIVKNILTSKNAVLIVDAHQDPRFAEQQSIIMSNLKSAMAVPLLDEDRVLGILYAETTNPVHRYNDDFLRLLATMGNIIASRLVNFALLREREEKHIYEAELLRASRIQHSLLPETVPGLPGYEICAAQEQCQAVGGDLYDVEKLPDGRLIFLVADVSGKGMGAALLMSNILASFRVLYSSAPFDAVLAVSNVSRLLYAHSPAETFATLFLGILDPPTGNIEYVNAGHNPALIVRPDGSIAHLEASGVMIGVFDAATWSSDQALLDPGSVLIIFTDGVTEAGIEVEEYSDARLERLVTEKRQESPAVLAQTIMKDIDDFTHDAPHSDDITMIFIKRNP
jgi:phosphoserine phosphatase RsbU/P